MVYMYSLYLSLFTSTPTTFLWLSAIN